MRHFLAMVVDNKILEWQGRGSIKDLPRPFFLKSTLFTKSGRGKPLKQPRPWSSGIVMCTIRAFKWGIVCFSVTLSSESTKIFVFYDIQEVGYNWPAVYTFLLFLPFLYRHKEDILTLILHTTLEKIRKVSYWF